MAPTTSSCTRCRCTTAPSSHCFFAPGDLPRRDQHRAPPAPTPARSSPPSSSTGVTTLFAPPTVWISLLRSPRLRAATCPRCSKGYYGASIMPVEVLQEMGRRLPGDAAVQLLRADRDGAGGHGARARGPDPQGRLGRTRRPSTSRPASSTTTTSPSRPAGSARSCTAAPHADARLLARRGAHGGGLPRRLVPQRRPRRAGRRGLPDRRRPQEGHDQDRRRERRQPRGRGDDLPAPGGLRGRGVRHPATRCGSRR